MFRLCHAIRLAPSSIAGTIAVTARCWNRIRQINTRQKEIELQENPTAQFDWLKLRLSIESGGCRGFMYKFQFENELIDPEEDVVLEAPPDENKVALSPPAELVVDKISLGKMKGATIDYHSELKGSAFVVVGNELMDESCSCGQSFNLK